MKTKTIIYPLIFVLMSLCVLGFEINEQFNTDLNSSIWSNKSVSGTLFSNVSNFAYNMYGNTSGSVQFNGGLFLATKNYINLTSSGLLQYTYTIDPAFSNNQYFFGGLGSGSDAGVGVAIQGGANIYVYNYKTGLIECSTDKKSLDTNPHMIKIIVSRVSNIDTVFNVYYDGVIWCSVTQVATITNLVANFSFTSQQNNYHSISLDNVYFTDNVSTSVLLNLGSYCDSGSDCVSGNCEYHYCTLKSGGARCTVGAECLTGSCTGGRCDKADFFTQIDYSKKQIFGDSQATNNIISLMLIFGVAILIMIIGGANILSGGVALGCVFMGAIFFTIVGWLSPFFLVGIFLIGLIVIILGFVMSSGG